MADEEGATLKAKLKVLYTFDAEHKVECLCRPASSYDVLTAPIDDSITVGIIDLRTCLDAVLESSPELTHFDERDYTVYAYDYSEPNTPLVGQGMLSKVLSQDRIATETMITGKVTKSPLAKLKKNIEPFLEVKLRFTPIASTLQRARSGSMSSVNEGMQSQFSSFSQVGPLGIDRPQSPADMARLESVHRSLHEGGQRRDSSHYNAPPWNSSRPGTPTQSQQYLPPQPGSSHSRQGSRFINYQPVAHGRRGSESGYGSGDEAFEEGPARKRAKTTKIQKSKKADFNIEQQPNSLRTAAMGASSLRMHQPAPINPTMALQRGFSAEEPVRPPTPQPKPRKPTGRPIGRPRKNHNVVNTQPSSPVAQNHLEPRLPPPTIPSPEEIRDRHLHQNVSPPGHPGYPPFSADMPSSPPLLFNRHNAPSPALPDIPAQVSQAGSNHDSGFFSAQVEEGEHDKTGKLNQDDLFCFDHPDLSVDMSNIDMSQWLNETGMDMNLDFGQLNEQGGDNHYTPVFDEESNFDGPTPQPGTHAPLGPTPQPEPSPQRQTDPTPTPQPEPQTIPTPTLQPQAAPQPRSPAKTENEVQFQRPALPAQSNSQQPTMLDKNNRPTPTLLPRPAAISLPPPPPPLPTAQHAAKLSRSTKKSLQRSQSVLPPVPASDPGTRTFQRSNTWTPNDTSDAVMSDAAEPQEAKGRRPKRIGKEQTKARLETAIANGGMPPYCYNCGAIETPAWRRGFIKHFTCPFESVETSLNPGEMCYKEIADKNEDGSVKSWKGWKIERVAGQADDDWEQINLCNPCGLWFHKQKFPRPPEKWQREKGGKRDKKRKRPPKPPKSRTNPPRAAAGNLTSDAIQSDAQEPPSEDSSPADTSIEDGPDDINDNMTVDGHDNEGSEEPELPPMPKIIMSAQLGRRTVKWAEPDRQAQSSPILPGSSAEPISLDLTPKPLRRLLFSPAANERREHPTKSGVLTEKLNGSLLPSFIRRSPRNHKTRDIFASTSIVSAVTVDGTADGEGKENVTPRLGMRDDLDELFGDFTTGDQEELMLPPMTPTPKRRSERISQRTPGRTPSREFGAEISGNTGSTSAETKTPKSKHKQDIAELFMDTITRNIDPKFMTPNTRAIYRACSDATTPSTRHTRGKTGFTPKGATPGQSSVTFDFPDLPSLKPSSPMSRDESSHIFSELPTERLFPDAGDSLDTDVLMPSSPPVQNSSVWNDDDFGDLIDIQAFDNTNWDFLDMPDSASKLRTPKKQADNRLLCVDTPGRASLRRSPRRADRE